MRIKKAMKETKDGFWGIKTWKTSAKNGINKANQSWDLASRLLSAKTTSQSNRISLAEHGFQFANEPKSHYPLVIPVSIKTAPKKKLKLSERQQQQQQQQKENPTGTEGAEEVGGLRKENVDEGRERERENKKRKEKKRKRKRKRHCLDWHRIGSAAAVIFRGWRQHTKTHRRERER